MWLGHQEARQGRRVAWYLESIRGGSVHMRRIDTLAWELKPRDVEV